MSIECEVMTASGEPFTVGPSAHGVALYGPVPVREFTRLQAECERSGYTIMDSLVSAAIGATACFTSPDGSVAWRAEIDARAAEEAGQDEELRWALGWDVGYSSLCIMACLVRQWVELESLYHQELPTGSCPRTYARMRALAEEGLRVPEATVDLAGLPSGAERANPGRFGAAFDDLLEVMLDSHPSLPDKLYVNIPPEPGARVLLWSRDAEEATMQTIAQARERERFRG